jgi:hypothetical protein
MEDDHGDLDGEGRDARQLLTLAHIIMWPQDRLLRKSGQGELRRRRRERGRESVRGRTLKVALSPLEGSWVFQPEGVSFESGQCGKFDVRQCMAEGWSEAGFLVKCSWKAGTEQ